MKKFMTTLILALMATFASAQSQPRQAHCQHTGRPVCSVALSGTVAEAKELVRTCVEKIGSVYRSMEVLSETEDSLVYIIGYTRNRAEGPIVSFSAKFEDGKVTFKGPRYDGVYASLRDGKC